MRYDLGNLPDMDNNNFLKGTELIELLKSITKGSIFLVMRDSETYCGKILDTEFFDNGQKWRLYPLQMFKLAGQEWIKEIKFAVELCHLSIIENTISYSADSISWEYDEKSTLIVMYNYNDFEKAFEQLSILPPLKEQPQ